MCAMSVTVEQVLRRELTLRGTSLDSFAESVGLSPSALLRGVQGKATLPNVVRFELGELVGVSLNGASMQAI